MQSIWDDLAKWLDENLWEDSSNSTEEEPRWWIFIGVIVLLLGVITFFSLKV
jgi:hypothetical protein